MSKDAYHHGNLKNELIERGLEYIDKYGVETLSLRKLAEESGVSCAAPYAHFENKETFLFAIQDYITERFMDVLTESSLNCEDRSRVLIEMGIGYVTFFYENPLYYHFLFNGKYLDLESYSPYIFFEQSARLTLGDGFDEEQMHYKIIALWSMIHGLAGLVTIKGIIDPDHIPEEVEKVMSAVDLNS
ncbi:MAG: TetR/AcrR family transcriptional regulator [Clostridiales bacterium]|nr:TetR/AcrR family transcriptional regulator [Clostridiales bacterium]